MKALVLLALAAAPLATLTVRGAIDSSAPGGHTPTIAAAADIQPASAVVQKQPAWVKDKAVASALVDVDPLWPADLPGLEALPAESPLALLQRTWPAWTAARGLIDELFGLLAADAQGDLEHLRDAKRRWEALQQKLDAAKLPASSALAALVEQRMGGLQQRIARLQSEAEAAQAAEAVKGALADGRFDEGLARSRQWLEQHSGAASPSLAEEIKALRLRAEFEAERHRAQARFMKTGLAPAERQAVLAAFLDRFSKAEGLTGSQRAVLEQCRKRLEALRAEAAAQEGLRAAEEAIRAGLADLPAGFDHRVAWAARIVQKHPRDVVRAALSSRVLGWLAEFLPEKRVEGPAELREAQTKDGRILRGYFREVQGAEGTVGYKCYDTLAQRQDPTVDVGTWPSADLASAPEVPLPQRLAARYRDARAKLLEQPDRRDVWEAFAALCERLQAQCDEYRAKPGAADEPLEFRAEAAFARQVLSGSALRDFRIVWGGSEEP